jgi:hypothetical protein
MFTSTTELTRTSADVAWPADFNAETKAYIKATFRDTGKLTGTEITESINGLTKTIVRTFVNEAAFAEWQADAELTTARESRRAVRGDGIVRLHQTS